jgi:hypothetical protein
MVRAPEVWNNSGGGGHEENTAHAWFGCIIGTDHGWGSRDDLAKPCGAPSEVGNQVTDVIQKIVESLRVADASRLLVAEGFLQEAEETA